MFLKSNISFIWQKKEDTIHRRVILDAIIKLLISRVRSRQIELTSIRWQNVLLYAQRLEYEIYQKAASFQEYINVKTLLPRYLCVASYLYNNNRYDQDYCKYEDKRLYSNTLSNVYSIRNNIIDSKKTYELYLHNKNCVSSETIVNDPHGYPLKSIYTNGFNGKRKRELYFSEEKKVPRNINKYKIRSFFLYLQEDILILIFSFIHLKQVIDYGTLINKYCYNVLNTCVKFLHINLMKIINNSEKTDFQPLRLFKRFSHLDFLEITQNGKNGASIFIKEIYNNNTKSKYETENNTIKLEKYYRASNITQTNPNKKHAIVDYYLKQIGFAINHSICHRLKALSICVNLSNNCYNNDDGLSILMNAIVNKLPYLRHLQFASCHLSDSEVKTITASLFNSLDTKKSTIYLETLDLRCNYIGENGIRYLNEGFLANPYSFQRLERLLLGGNILTDSCVPYLCNILSNTEQHLDFNQSKPFPTYPFHDMNTAHTDHENIPNSRPYEKVYATYPKILNETSTPMYGEYYNHYNGMYQYLHLNGSPVLHNIGKNTTVINKLKILALDCNFFEENGIMDILNDLIERKHRFHNLQQVDFGNNNTQNAAFKIADVVRNNIFPNLLLINAGNVSELGAKEIDKALSVRKKRSKKSQE